MLSAFVQNITINKIYGLSFNLVRRFLFQESRMSRSRRGHPKASPSKEGQALEEESREELEPEESPPGSTLVESEELPYMATTEMYLCCWHQPPPSPWRDQSPVQDDTVSGENALS